MGDIALRNIDLMRHMTKRRPTIGGGAPLDISQTTPRTVEFVWDDIALANFVVTRVRQQSLPKCIQITIQFSYVTTAVPFLAPYPTLQIRDQSVGPATPAAVQLGGYELIPGEAISWACEENEISEGVFLRPETLYMMLAAVGAGRAHVQFGILS